MKVMAWFVSSVKYRNGKAVEKDQQQKTFDSVEQASRFFSVSEKRILNCIETGRKWRGVTYDEGI